MTEKPQPKSARLFYEPASMDHLDAFHRMNSNPRVMTYLGGRVESREDTVRWIENCERRWRNQGHGWWALREIASGRIIGAAALQQLEEQAVLPLEIGWRLHPDGWGRGLATEAGQAMIDVAFDHLGETRICAVAEPENVKSRKVMERLGLTYQDVRTHYGLPLAYYELRR